MSSLLLSQSLISSAENSFREQRSLQKQDKNNNNNNGNSSTNRYQNPKKFNKNSKQNPFIKESNKKKRMKNFQEDSIIFKQDVEQERDQLKAFKKFCWLVFISIWVLLFYVVLFVLLATTCYLLIVWIPKDLERNKLNMKLYESIVNHSNILLISQYNDVSDTRKILLTRDLYWFEMRQDLNSESEYIMNLATKPIDLQAKYPALFWNEDFRNLNEKLKLQFKKDEDSILNHKIHGAVWPSKNKDDKIVIVFTDQMNENTTKFIIFDEMVNHVQIDYHNSKDIIVISSKKQRFELIRLNHRIWNVYSDFNDKKINICFGYDSVIYINSNDTLNCRSLTFLAAFTNETHLNLLMENNQALITSIHVLDDSNGNGKYPFITQPIEQLIPNGLLTVLSDYLLFTFASIFFVIIIILLLIYVIKRRKQIKEQNDVDHESQPLLPTSRPKPEESAEYSKKWLARYLLLSHSGHHPIDKSSLMTSAQNNSIRELNKKYSTSKE